MHHEVQQTRDVGLKNVVFDGFFLSIAHACHASSCIAEFLRALNWQGIGQYSRGQEARAVCEPRAGREQLENYSVSALRRVSSVGIDVML
jgi:hypothetical protein